MCLSWWTVRLHPGSQPVWLLLGGPCRLQSPAQLRPWPHCWLLLQGRRYWMVAEPCILAALFVTLSMLLPLAFPCTPTHCVIVQGQTEPTCPPGESQHMRCAPQSAAGLGCAPHTRTLLLLGQHVSRCSATAVRQAWLAHRCTGAGTLHSRWEAWPARLPGALAALRPSPAAGPGRCLLAVQAGRGGLPGAVHLQAGGRRLRVPSCAGRQQRAGLLQRAGHAHDGHRCRRPQLQAGQRLCRVQHGLAASACAIVHGLAPAQLPQGCCYGAELPEQHPEKPRPAALSRRALRAGEDAIRHLLSRGTHREFGYAAVCAMLATYFLGACWAAGSAIASGLFVPMLLIGSCVGRLAGLLCVDIAAAGGHGSPG